jgi:hypothetical protein
LRSMTLTVEASDNVPNNTAPSSASHATIKDQRWTSHPCSGMRLCEKVTEIPSGLSIFK